MTRGFPIVAAGAVTGLGRGAAAVDVGATGDLPRAALADDAILAEAGLVRARSARVSDLDRGDDPARALLLDAVAQIAGELDRVRPGWREVRVGLCVGTSSGGMVGAERYFQARFENRPRSAADVREATYFAPFAAAARSLGVELVKRCQLVAACASSTIALGLATRWLERQACDLVIAGGYDGLSLFVAAGFEGLRATSASWPQPFRQGRDGMLLGEAATLVALARDGEGLAWITGFGASADAVHITAPDRDGKGLVRAGRRALVEAGLDPARVGLVSAHATATPYNDAAEAKAIRALCPHMPPVHPFKAQVGHTLGAAGATETLALAQALNRQVAPGAGGTAPLDPEAEVTILPRNEARRLDAGLKLSAAFGGVTASLVLERVPSGARRQRRPRPVWATACARVTEVERPALAEATGLALDRIARIDELGQLALAAVAALAASVGRARLEGAGVVAGYGLATLDTNERFYGRLLRKGPRWVDPRLFPATSPNAGAGHCAIAFGLTGPNFAVNGGLDGGREALAAGAELVAMGDAPRMVVVAADDDGPAAREWLEHVAPGRPHAKGAVAVLLDVEGDGSPIDLDAPIDHEAGPVGHLGLLTAVEV